MKKKTARKSGSKAKTNSTEPKAEATANPTTENHVPAFLAHSLKTGAEKEAEANAVPSTPAEAAAQVSQGGSSVQADPVQASAEAAKQPDETEMAAATEPADEVKPAETEQAVEKPAAEETTSFSISNIMNTRRGQASVEIQGNGVTEGGEEKISEIGKKKKIKPFYIITGVLFVLILIALGYFLYSRSRSTESATTQTDRNAVADLMLLPVEDTLIATVTSAGELTKINELFATANNGDRLLIFIQSKRVVVFRPATNQIVTFAQLNSLGGLASSSGLTVSNPELLELIKDSSPASGSLTIQIRNGTAASGITLDLQQQIEAFGDKFVVEKRTSAASLTFTETKIYNLASAEKLELVLELADALGLKIEDKLPAGEAATDSDIVIIVGADKI